MTEVAWRMFPGQLLGRFEGSENPAVATVFSLLNTPGGALWAGLREGIVTYQYLRWKKTSSVQDADLAWFRNQLWHTGEDHYLFCHQAGTWHPVSVPFAWCRRLQVDSVGYLWALPREGLWRSLDGQQWEQIALPWPKPFVHNLSIDTANTLWMWIHGQSAIYHWADGQIETLPPPRKAKRLNEVITLRADTRGRLWFGTRAPGVWWWDGTIWNQVSIARHAHETGLIGALAQDLCIDHEDRIWVATERGIACCIAGVWHPIVIALEAPLPDRPVPICPIYTNWYRLHLDLKGRLWLGSGQFGEVAWIDTRCDPYPNSQEYRIEERELKQLLYRAKVIRLQAREMQVDVQPNQRVELTPLRSPKIAAFLKEGSSSTAFPIERAAQFTRRALGRSRVRTRFGASQTASGSAILVDGGVLPCLRDTMSWADATGRVQP